ncbi:hypothetical protein MASR1M8_25010 [Thermomonas brevis]
MNAPRVGFVIGGAQKAGTSALAAYLARHPGIALPRGKEAHVFDAPDFDEAADAGAIDARYAAHFDAQTPGVLHGDATPIYMLHPRFIARIHRYNPAMRWILLLRHPVDRALSQYHMERARGDETLPLWLALALERWRLHGHADDFAPDSPLRRHSYRLRGDYARQLDALHARFPPAQVLVVRQESLADAPEATLARCLAFLGLAAHVGDSDYPRVHAGDYRPWPPGDWRRRAVAWWWRRDLHAQQRHGLDWGPA